MSAGATDAASPKKRDEGGATGHDDLSRAARRVAEAHAHPSHGRYFWLRDPRDGTPVVGLYRRAVSGPDYFVVGNETFAVDDVVHLTAPLEPPEWGATDERGGPVFASRDVARVARVVNALRMGLTVDLPEVETGRGMRLVERFRFGASRPGEGDSFLRRTTTWRPSPAGAETKVLETRWSPLSWSLGDLFDVTAHWPPETLKALPDVARTELEAPWMVALRALDDTGRCVVAGTEHVMSPREPTEDEPCAATVSTQGSGEWSAQDLVEWDAPRHDEAKP